MEHAKAKLAEEVADMVTKRMQQGSIQAPEPPKKKLRWDITLACLLAVMAGFMVIRPPQTAFTFALWLAVMFGVSIYPALHLAEWILKARRLRFITTFTVTVTVLGIIFAAIGLEFVPQRIFCYVKPVSNGITGVILAMINSGPTSIQGVSFTMGDSQEHKVIQSCKIGSVIGNQKLFVLSPCQAYFPIDKDTQWQFEIHTNDDIFMENVTVKKSGLSSTCELSSIANKEKLLNGECP